MKIKRTNRGTPVSASAKTGGVATGGESTKRAEKIEIADKVTLSEGVMAVNGASGVEPANADGSNGPLPDPKATSQAIIEKELASVFKEIYL